MTTTTTRTKTNRIPDRKIRGSTRVPRVVFGVPPKTLCLIRSKTNRINEMPAPNTSTISYCVVSKRPLLLIHAVRNFQSQPLDEGQLPVPHAHRGHRQGRHPPQTLLVQPR